MKFKTILMLAVLALAAVSCSTPKDITYMQNADKLPTEVLAAAAKQNDPVIMPGDMLFINVSASDPEVVKPFNKTQYVSQTSNMNSNNDNSIYYYLVDNNGYIDYPLLGRIHIGGMTQSAAQSYIASLIYPKYVTERPGVEIRFQNFHVYVLGEVNSPGQVKASNGRMNLLEALAMAGDLTIQGKRENVMVVRTNADGSRQVNYVNLNDKNTLVSPSFNLQQNDIIYVEPNDSKKRSSFTVAPAWTLAMSAVGTVVSIVTLIVTLTK